MLSNRQLFSSLKATGAAVQVQSVQRDGDELHAGGRARGRVERVERGVHGAVAPRQVVEKIHRVDELLQHGFGQRNLHKEDWGEEERE